MASYNLRTVLKMMGQNILNWVKSNCVNNLLSTSTSLPLAAAQGKVLDEKIDKINQSLANIILDKLYPVGSIYLETTNTNPSAKLGGEWAAYGASDTYLRLGGSGNGGINSVTLTANQIPSLTGSTASAKSTFTAFTKYGVGAGTNTKIIDNKMSADTYGGSGNYFWQGTYQNEHTHSVSIPNNSQKSVTIAPKYVAVYAWKRIK